MASSVETQAIQVLVTGVPQSGKSTLVKTISQYTGDDQGWFSGYVSVDETLDVQFLEPPPQPDFDFLWFRDLLSEAEMPGFVVVCDSTRPESFNETLGILQVIRVYHPDTPCIVVANKQDNPEAWRVEDIRLALGNWDDRLVFPCVAHQTHLVKEVILQLLYQILNA
jgi:signal recognition particle receptor subunit beta